MNLVTTRGCPYHCNWCAKPIYGQRYTARSPEHVVDEMAWLKRTFRPDHLWIADDIFGLKPGWIERFAALLQARDAATPFKCLLRADQVTADDRARAARRRLPDRVDRRRVGIAADPRRDGEGHARRADRRRHAAAARRRRRRRLLPAVRLSGRDARGHRSHARRWCATARPDDIGVSVSYPLPGTTFYQRVQAQLGQKQNWVDSERPRDDVPRDLRARLLSRAARAGARRVPGGQVEAAASRRRVVASVDARHAASRRAAIARRHQSAKASLLQRRLSRLARMTARGAADAARSRCSRRRRRRCRPIRRR